MLSMATEVECITFEEESEEHLQFCPYCDDTGESLLHLKARLHVRQSKASRNEKPSNRGVGVYTI